MSYKPSDAELMAYLYDELDEKDRNKIAQYLAANHDAMLSYNRLKEVRDLMSKIQDQEVIAPAIILQDAQKKTSMPSYIKFIATMAAAIALLMIFGRLTDFHIGFADRTVMIGSGKTDNKSQSADHSLTTAVIDKMIHESLMKNNEALKSEWITTHNQSRSNDNDNIGNVSLSKAQLNKLIKEVSLASQAQVKQYVNTMQVESANNMKDYLKLTSPEQKTYIENLLVGFAQYLQQQRASDLELVQSRLSNIEQNNDQLKQETEQILSGIISTVSTPSDGVKY